MPNDRHCLPLEAGRNCWRVCRAQQAAVLVDAAAYFRAARQAILGARSAVYIVGWDLHSATMLVAETPPDEPDADARTLREVLDRAVTRNPEVRVYLLLWDWAVLYAGERELLPRLNLDWRLPPAVRLELDSAALVGASQHQKLLVVDDEVAYCGGLDLTVRRWDRRRHALDEPARVDHLGEPYAPYHDVQLAVTGEAAVALGDEARRRWLAATGERLEPPSARTIQIQHALSGSEGAAIRLEGMRAAIARTVPASNVDETVTEVRDSLLAMIASARHYIYVENQFVCADVIGRALAKQLQANPRLEALIVTPRAHKGWLESRSMGAGRARFLQHLAAGEVLDRAPLVYPVRRENGQEQEVFVHSKVMIVDGRFLRIGSANLNNRSMGYDAECDVILTAEDDAGRARISEVLLDLLAEHLGVEADTLANAIARHGFLAGVRELDNRTASLKTISEQPSELSLNERLYINLADPEEPVSVREFLRLVSDERVEPAKRRTSLLPLLLAVAALALLAGAWRFTPLSELARPESLESLLGAMRGATWTPILVLGAFVLGGFVMLPVTALILATGIAFDAITAFAYATSGSLLSAASGYAAGRYLDAQLVERALRGRVRRIAGAVRQRGIVAMATVRMIPAAPFMVVNVVAGTARIRLRDYLIGTALGMVPGIAIVTAFGNSVGTALRELSWSHVAQAAALALVWLALIVAAKRLLKVNADSDRH